jgi:1-acyl-sn-glycerol-3-phosphate acyltransferase
VVLDVEGLEILREHPGPFVVVSNHESYYDIPCLYAALPLSLRMAAKQELFRTPLWGPALRASGFVEINRKSPEDAYRALHAAGQLMRAHHLSLYIAPEGTRTSDGELGRFKKGAFEVARVTGLCVLPVALRGTRFVHKKGDRHVNPGCHVGVRILPPMPPLAFPSSIDMAESARERILEALHKK